MLWSGLRLTVTEADEPRVLPGCALIPWRDRGAQVLLIAAALGGCVRHETSRGMRHEASRGELSLEPSGELAGVLRGNELG